MEEIKVEKELPKKENMEKSENNENNEKTENTEKINNINNDFDTSLDFEELDLNLSDALNDVKPEVKTSFNQVIKPTSTQKFKFFS